SHPTGILAADLDGDGAPDLAVLTDQGLFVLRNAGGLGFDAPLRVNADAEINRSAPPPVAADIDGDHDLDLITSDPATRAPAASPNLGGGEFASRVPVSTQGSDALTAADFNGDGRADLAVGGDQGAELLLSSE